MFGNRGEGSVKNVASVSVIIIMQTLVMIMCGGEYDSSTARKLCGF